jgi:uncharacterized protein
MTPVNVIDLKSSAATRDDTALLKLNNAFSGETSELTLAKLQHMILASFMASAIGRDDALLIAFDQDAIYDSPNFLWFKQRLTHFVYVDRIIVAAHARSRGLARSLYQTLFTACRLTGHTYVVCEVNIDPPNPASDAFHARLGFTEMGRAALANGKTVRYLAHAL